MTRPTPKPLEVTMPLCGAVTLGDLAVVLFILDARGPSTHDELYAEYLRLTGEQEPLKESCFRYVTWHLAAQCRYIMPDPIAGRSARGRKARRWKLAGTPTWRRTPHPNPETHREDTTD